VIRLHPKRKQSSTGFSDAQRDEEMTVFVVISSLVFIEAAFLWWLWRWYRLTKRTGA
jgi:hypothetical protein